jgi:hypothetical protein
MKASTARGGFYPSVMTGLIRTGPYFMTAAAAQASRLIRNNKTRMSKRKGSRKTRRRRTKRTKRS